MLVAKQVADILTFGRAMLAFVLIGLGLYQSENGLPVAALVMLASWTSDTFDGPIARRSRVQYRTWIGDHDLEVDMSVALGLLIFMLETGYVSLWIGVVYLLVAGLAFWHWGIHRSWGMLFQAPIYGWFIWTTLRNAPIYGALLVLWIALVVIVTWPKFPKEVVPGFLDGMRIKKKEGRPSEWRISKQPAG